MDRISEGAASDAEEPGAAGVNGEEPSATTLGKRRASGAAPEGEMFTRWASEVSLRGDWTRRARGRDTDQQHT